MKILVLTRKMKGKANFIYNSYTNGITKNYPDSIVIDYFDLYFDLAKENFEKKILETIKVKKIDIVFINFISGDLTFDLKFLQKIESVSYLIMNFYDSELFFEPIERYYAQCANLVILPTSSAFTYYYKILNINTTSTLSLFDIKKYENKKIKKDIDISFIGNIEKKSRQEFISFLQDKGYKVETYGLGTKNGKVSFDEMIDIFNRTKINLNFSDTITYRSFNRTYNTNYSTVPKITQFLQQLKGRTIEVALCGSFTLSQDALGIDELFGKDEIDTFKTKDELLQKVKYYLDNEDIIEEKSNLAYKTAIVKFDVERKFKELFENLDLKNKIEKKIFIDDAFLSNFYTYHILYLFNFLFKGRFKDFYQEFKLIEFRKLDLITSYYHITQQFKYQVINKLFKGRK